MEAYFVCEGEKNHLTVYLVALSDDGAIEFGLYAQEKNALNVTQELWYSSGAEYLAQNVQGPRWFYLHTHTHTHAPCTYIVI